MRYLSIDIETTGLNPDTCDVIEFAAVAEDTLKPEIPVEDLPHFRALIRRDNYRGEPFALAMHAELFKEIANTAIAAIAPPIGPVVCAPAELLNIFTHWLMAKANVWIAPPNTPIVGHRMLVAGKNFAGFDLRFLRRLTDNIDDAYNGAKWDSLFSHRVLDPAMFFTLAEDEKPPSLAECLDRAGCPKAVSHRALDDARDVIRCIRAGMAKTRVLTDEEAHRAGATPGGRREARALRTPATWKPES